jgi:ferredoxin-NADP reductase
MTVVRRAEEAEGVLSVTLAPADSEALPDFQPGQYIMVQADGADGRPVGRAYSLSRSGRHCRDYRISVKRVSDAAVMSSYVHESLKVGDALQVGRPEGSFRIPVDADFPVVLVAAGIGITPFISYLETLAAATMPEVVLLYGNRNRRSHAFVDRIREIARQLPRLTVRNFYSRPEATDISQGVFDGSGRISAATVDPSLIARRARFYLCGPDGMLREMVAGLVDRGVPRFEIFLERFLTPADPGPLDATASYRVRFARTGRTATWRGGDGTLMRLGETGGVVLPSGCRTGQCESCAVRVLSGKVRHLVPIELDDPALCLTCQAIPASDLVLDA